MIAISKFTLTQVWAAGADLVLFCGLFVILLLVSPSARAQSQKAIVINQGALVYTQSDFDAPVLTELKAGGVYDISLKTRGPFYKIRIKPNVTGWIADTDVRVGKFKGRTALRPKDAKNGKGGPAAAEKKGLAKNTDPTDGGPTENKAKPVKPRRPFMATRFRGPVVADLAYAEDTMGALRTETLPFFGFKMEGPNVLISGDMRTDVEFIFHPGAPKFYEKATGQSASGWIFLTDFIFETALPQSSWHMVTFGFGPMFKYTHYEVALLDSGHPLNYSLDDMTLGAVFDGGLAFRVGSYALRFNVKYFWEKTKYFGGSLTFGFPF
jgi:hypothetical protein